MFSDHRPVYATFNATVVVVDEDIKNRLANELYNRRRLEVGDANDLVSLIDLNETTLTHGLPPHLVTLASGGLLVVRAPKLTFSHPLVRS